VEAGMKQMFNLKEKTFESLIRTKLFKSEEELLKEAIGALFYKRPELKREVAMDMYKNKEISLWKAAQMCGVSLEEFKEILRSRGIRLEVETTKQETEKRLRKIFG
jgi:predicted HTH domain antitoxin